MLDVIKEKICAEVNWSRTLEAEDDGCLAVSDTTASLASSFAEIIESLGFGLPIIAAMNTGRLAFQWAYPKTIIMLTVGDNHKINLSSNVKIDGKDFTAEYNFNELEEINVDMHRVKLALGL